MNKIIPVKAQLGIHRLSNPRFSEGSDRNKSIFREK